MNKQICIIIFLLTCRICDAQYNLVPNPSFEQYDTCPTFVSSQLHYSAPWFSATHGSPDYFNVCATSWVGVPLNCVGSQNARTGVAYAGFGAYFYSNPAHNSREYIEVKLDTSLVVGTKYYISFYVSMADTCTYATDDIGAYLSVDSTLSNTYYVLQDTPQIVNVSGNILSDKNNWTVISGTYIAQGGERFITIGNFVDDANIDTVFIPGGALSQIRYLSSYYYVDDVCISTDSLTCYSPVGINEIKNEEDLVLFPNPFADKINITARRNEELEVSLYDVTSRKIFNQSFTASTTINTEQLAKGIYLYEVRNKSGVIKKGKVVKD